MVRGTIEDYHIDDIRVTIEFDSGGPVGATTVVSVGEPDDWAVTRWFYWDEDNDRYVKNFAEKVVKNEDYREKCLDRTAEWARVADQYEETSREIFEWFRNAGVMGYTSGNKEEKQTYQRAKNKLETICESLFNELKDEIRGDNNAETVEDIVDRHKNKAWTWLKEQGHITDHDSNPV